MGELIVHVGPARPRLDGQADQQHARRGQRRRAGRGDRAWRKAAGLDRDALLEVAARERRRLGDARPQGRARCSRSDFEPLFKLEHMLKDVRHCIAEARGLGHRAAAAARSPRSSTRGPTRTATASEDFAAVYTGRRRSTLSAVTASPIPPARPRLRGVVHQWSFFVALVAGAALVAWAPGRPGDRRLRRIRGRARGPAGHQRALPPRHLAPARARLAAPARPLDDLRADRRHLHAVRGAGARRPAARGGAGRRVVRRRRRASPYAGLGRRAQVAGGRRLRGARLVLDHRHAADRRARRRGSAARCSRWEAWRTRPARSSTRGADRIRAPATFGYHEIFHVLVVLAAAAHFAAVAAFAAPTAPEPAAAPSGRGHVFPLKPGNRFRKNEPPRPSPP